MNWLVIALDEKSSVVEKVKSLLRSKHNVSVSVLEMKEAWSKDTLYENIKRILQATHCIMLDGFALKKHADYSFILGVLAGKKVRTFIYEGKPHELRYEEFDPDFKALLTSYSDLDKMLAFIDIAFDDFVLQNLQHEALVQLFTLGIPFTSDSFAYYLSKDDTEICKMFFDAGMLVNARTSEGVPLLCVATRSEFLDKVKWLLEKGADINAISKDRGYSAVMDAVWRKNYEITKYLISKGADLHYISSDGQPILVLAVGNGNEAITRLLLEHGADPDVKDSMGMSAREYVNLFRKPALIELMKQYPPKSKES